MTVFSIGFSRQAQEPEVVSVTEQDELAEFEQVWVWDLYYAKTLYELGDSAVAMDLRESLDGWAVQMASKAFLPMRKIEQAGLHRLHPDLTVTTAPALDGEVYRVEVARPEGEWPLIHTQGPEPGAAQRKAYSVIALAEYFFLKNKLFRREVALHVLAFRKYYTDGRAHTEPVSMVEAPLFAVNKALEFFESMQEQRAAADDTGPERPN
ncbi:MAG: hypothetical protein B7Z66_03190 [Chromatiales bacterium 21-64-14]|nr:MAG: hypothetical protein B7Z66_03190 [Chromatiales bacterium 21-64-14]HQU15857.1 hypothetical protein [Gammaproteobacteria bacterium]